MTSTTRSSAGSLTEAELRGHHLGRHFIGKQQTLVLLEPVTRMDALRTVAVNPVCDSDRSGPDIRDADARLSVATEIFGHYIKYRWPVVIAKRPYPLFIFRKIGIAIGGICPGGPKSRGAMSRPRPPGCWCRSRRGRPVFAHVLALPDAPKGRDLVPQHRRPLEPHLLGGVLHGGG